ncbi:hypothetical protein ACH5RR_032101 [Cinchona calisaya]|uniref:Uncharacterized protein n=1 Tax=Cinchona calisaya TaxID=153742 RepID=A0ABD2YJT2_9GENT
MTRMSAFKQVLDDCGLLDSDFVGRRFTWWGKSRYGSLIHGRLDRAVCNAVWLDLFKEEADHHQIRTMSDHKPLLVYTQPPPPGGEKLFRLGKCQVDHADFPIINQSFWSNQAKPFSDCT